MKTKILTFFLVIVFYAGANAQNKVCDEVFEKYAGKKGFTSIKIPGLALKLFVHDKTNPDFKLTTFRLLSVEDPAVNANLNFYDEIIPNLNRDEYEELISIKEKDRNFIILCKSKDNKITEFILVSGGKDNLLINFTGRISLSDMYKITQSISHDDKLKELDLESPDK